MQVQKNFGIIPFQLFWLLSLTLICNPVVAQEPTVGLIRNEQADPGYILFTPLNHRTTYLIDRDGKLVHSWESNYVPGMSAYLSEDGFLYRAGRVTDDTYLNSGGAGGTIEMLDWDGNLAWEFRYSTPLVRQHHDFEILPDGNVLILAWEKKTREEAEQAGRNPGAIGAGQLWPDHLVEVKPQGQQGGEIVWEWHVWDHLIQDVDPSNENYGIIADHPEKININYYQNSLADWIHGNAVEYHPGLDQIMVSSRGFNEIWIIDHSTTTEEARTGQGGRSGKGGDLLWRWGNPPAYDLGSASDQRLFGQHGLHWVWSAEEPGGTVYLYNNGNGRQPEIYSTVESLVLTPTITGNYPKGVNGIFLPEDFTETFVPADSQSIYAPLFSNVINLGNDHLLLCVGPRGTFMEYDHAGNEIWKYVNPVTETGRILNQGESIGDYQASINAVFSIGFYPAGFSGFHGRQLISKGVIEGDVITSYHEASYFVNVYPNPTSGYLFLESLVNIEHIRIVDRMGRTFHEESNPDATIDLSRIPSGIYWCVFNHRSTLKIVIEP